MDRRDGDQTQLEKLRKDLMRARTGVIKLHADLKDEKDRTDMFAKEVCDLIKDKDALIAERDILNIEVDELPLTLG